MDKTNQISKKIIIGVGIIFAILIVAGIVGNNMKQEKEKKESLTEKTAGDTCFSFINNADGDESDPRFWYNPDVWSERPTEDVGKTKDGKTIYHVRMNGKNGKTDVDGVFHCYISGTPEDYKVYEVKFVTSAGTGENVYGEADSWLDEIE